MDTTLMPDAKDPRVVALAVIVEKFVEKNPYPPTNPLDRFPTDPFPKESISLYVQVYAYARMWMFDPKRNRYSSHVYASGVLMGAGHSGYGHYIYDSRLQKELNVAYDVLFG